MADLDKEFYQMYPYKVPDWASHLNNIPTSYVKLSNLNTPIHKWNLPDIPEDVSIHIKRDDLTGADLSGNKVRCLQIMFAEALLDGSKHIVTGGIPDSAQCRAMSLACRLLGLTPHIINTAKTKEDIGHKGNALLYRIAGSHIYLTPFTDFKSFQARVQTMAEFIGSKYQEKCYPFPAGGSSVQGVFGFISLFEELLKQGLHDRFDDIVLPIATCPTSTGLAVANYLTGSKLKIHSFPTGLPNDILINTIDGLLKELGLDDVKASDIVDIIDERYGTDAEEMIRQFAVSAARDVHVNIPTVFKKKNRITCTGETVLRDRKMSSKRLHVERVIGLAKTYRILVEPMTATEDFITKVTSTTGILLDPVFTGKAALGLIEELRKNPNRFKGNRILFIHTGGMFSLFSKEVYRIIDQSDLASRFISWPDANIPPWDS